MMELAADSAVVYKCCQQLVRDRRVKGVQVHDARLAAAMLVHESPTLSHAELGGVCALLQDCHGRSPPLPGRCAGLRPPRGRGAEPARTSHPVRLCYDASVRTTLAIPDEAYYLVKNIARDQTEAWAGLSAT
jgi:hypothetical protein